MKCCIYHSLVGSRNLSSIRIIIYSAAEAQELLRHCRWENICWALGSGLPRAKWWSHSMDPLSHHQSWLTDRKLQGQHLHLRQHPFPSSGSKGSAPTPAFLVLQLCPPSIGQHRTFSPGSTPLQWIAISILILHAWTPMTEYILTYPLWYLRVLYPSTVLTYKVAERALTIF